MKWLASNLECEKLRKRVVEAHVCTAKGEVEIEEDMLLDRGRARACGLAMVRFGVG